MRNLVLLSHSQLLWPAAVNNSTTTTIATATASVITTTTRENAPQILLEEKVQMEVNEEEEEEEREDVKRPLSRRGSELAIPRDEYEVMPVVEPPPTKVQPLLDLSFPDIVTHAVGMGDHSYVKKTAYIAQIAVADDVVYAISQHGDIAKFIIDAYNPNDEVMDPSTIVTSIPNIDTEHHTFVAMEYLSELGVCSIAVSSGGIYTFDITTNELELVGSVEGGLFSMEWSPDQELAIVATGNDTLLQMTKYFDVLTEFPIHVDDEGVEKKVTVGWGKEETQFQGSRGREHLKNKKEIPVTEFTTINDDDSCPRVSWRGDGKYFACSAVNHETNIRFIRIYDREGVLLCMNEKMKGLYHCLNWRPSGNLITASQKLQHKHNIVFFERNGLAHGEFSLLKVDLHSTVRDVFWNADSSILCVLLQRNYNGERSSVVQLWTMNNYHYYLKYEYVETKFQVTAVKWDPQRVYRLHVCFANGCLSTFNFCYDVATSTSLRANNAGAVAVIDGNDLLVTPFRFMNVPPPMSAYKTTHENPISEVSFGGWDISSNAYALLFSSNSIPTIDFHDVPSVGKSCKSPVHIGHLSLDVIYTELGRYRHVCWPRKNLILLVESHPNLGDLLIAIQLKWLDSVNTNGVSVVEVIHYVRKPCPSFVYRLHDNPSAKVVLMQTREGALYSVHVDKNLSLTERVTVQPWKFNTSTGAEFDHDDDEDELGEEGGIHPQLPYSCPWLQVVEVTSNAEEVAEENRRRFSVERRTSAGMEVLSHLESAYTPSPSRVHRTFAQSSRGKFFVDGEEISADVTSFAVHNEFLVFTTLAHRVHFLPLAMSPSDMKTTLLKSVVTPDNLTTTTLPSSTTAASDSSKTAINESLRSVERGSRIVTVVVHDVSLVLQMPRGNLETICPRALALSSIRENIGVQNYGRAFTMARKHRIDLNVLHDCDPIGFMDNLDTFLHQVNDVDYLNLFLSTLRNEDTTITMYPSMKSLYAPTTIESSAPTQTDQKVNRVCSAIRYNIETTKSEEERTKYMRCLVTSYVVQTPPDLESALNLIRSVYETPEFTPIAQAKVAQREADSLLTYAIFLVDVNKLYDVALGMYDLGLVLLIAQKSQKDPKEYLPFLSSLKKMEKYHQRFTIDDYLKRHTSAMENLSKILPETNETDVDLIDYIEKHKLYLHALTYFQEDEATWKKVMKVYAEQLEISGIYLEAGLAYYRAGHLEQALNCYQRAGQWRRVLSIAKQLNYTDEQVKSIAYSLTQHLKDHTNYSDAALIYEQYLDHPEEAVKCLLTGALFMEAERIAYKYSRADLMETSIIPGAVDAYVSYTTEISNHLTLFEKQIARLAIVRENKSRWIDMVNAGTATTSIPLSAVDFDNVEMFSETSSIASNTRSKKSQTSQSSRKTGKSKRKAERRKVSGKEGSRFEEEFLLDSLCKIANRSNVLRNDVHELLHVLVSAEKLGEARSLQRQFQHLLDTIARHLPRLEPPIILPAREDDTEDDRKGVPESVRPTLSTTPWSLDVLSTPRDRRHHH